MKQCIIYLFISIFLSGIVKAQRMLPKQKAIEIIYGIPLDQINSKHYFINTGLSIQRGNGNYSLLGIEYYRTTQIYEAYEIPIETYTAQAGYSINLIGDRQKSIMLNISLSAIIGYENINKGDNLLYDGALLQNESTIIYGVNSRISLDIYICNPLVLAFQINTKALLNTTLDTIRPSTGVGIKINL